MKKRNYGFVYLIIIGAIGAALWEIVLRPGGSVVTEKTVALMSHFSIVFQNSIYSEAGKTPIQMTIILLGLALVFLFGAEFLLLKTLLDPAFEEPEAEEEEIEESWMERYKSSFGVGEVFGAMFLLIIFLGSLIFLAWQNAIEEVRREFTTNQLILRPYVTVQVSEDWNSRFAQMKTREDYNLIREEMRRTAISENLEFREIR